MEAPELDRAENEPQAEDFRLGGSSPDVGFYEVRDNHTLEWKDESTAAIHRPPSDTAALITAHHGDTGAMLPKDVWPRVDVPIFDQDGDGAEGTCARVTGIKRVSRWQLDELNTRIQKIATDLRLSDFAIDVKLQLHEEERGPMSIAAGNRIFDSVFLTEVPDQPTENKNVKEYVHPPARLVRTVEQASFPGLPNASHLLPHGISPRKTLTRAISQGHNLAPTVNRPRFRAKIALEQTEHILCDYFWWIWLDRFRGGGAPETAKPNGLERDASSMRCSELSPAGDDDAEAKEAKLKETQIWEKETESLKDQLFGRIAQNYVQILLQTASRDRDELSFLYTNLISQSTTLAFTDCFPDSLPNFDPAFAVSIADVLSEWIVGMRPTFASGWTQGVRSARLNKSTVNKEGRKDQEQNFLDLMSGADTAQDNPKGALTSLPSAHPNTLPVTRRVLFDANATTSIISRYVGKSERRTLPIHRTEVLRSPPPPPDSPTYRSLIADSVRRSRMLQRGWRASMEEAARERMRLVQGLNEQLARERRRIRGILARPEHVRDLADRIMDDMTGQSEGIVDHA
ncbi:uncharacterized protein EV422DRAFT_563455 [Fimicolochytrium jonesii]|uniref:uncharacterized protein n=1 Tax=Fimicolochytrium jonesii TaxID=1396493 RepID=UPI0022FF3661|nr:uncharacterized protein EV422DRAFT_563455 [Fimicolochytrium jonesii]KAI8825624.1 hypothetical protein EV422DRAFT_563455 [Fimicolochytrium jonesii]